MPTLLFSRSNVLGSKRIFFIFIFFIFEAVFGLEPPTVNRIFFIIGSKRILEIELLPQTSIRQIKKSLVSFYSIVIIQLEMFVRCV